MIARIWKSPAGVGLALALATGLVQNAAANGGPFVIKYPNGDPAAKGVLARIDPDLKPGREDRLRVVKEELKIVFAQDPAAVRRAGTPVARTPTVAPGSPGPAPLAPDRPVPPGVDQPPLAVVSAVYTIENPTEQPVEVEFGFPILRGIYMQPWSMMPSPDAQVTLDQERIRPEIISNSMIYGLIRQRAREVIEKAIAADPELARLVARVRTTGYVRQRAREAIRQVAGEEKPMQRAIELDGSLARLAAIKSDAADPDRAQARQDLMYYAKGQMKWETGSATLLVEYASMQSNVGADAVVSRVNGLPAFWGGDLGDFGRLAYANLGPLNAMGEQKATQLFAELAARFDPSTRTAYEAIFAAWGGDVRERSIDLATGRVRPRELTLDPNVRYENLSPPYSDPTLYARMEYINPNAKITDGEKASCRAILQHLPVTFTFAPMNLLHYKAAFPAKTTRTLTVSYKQFAYMDTAKPASYQLAYVVHPASLWKEFGPIELEIAMPAGDTPEALSTKRGTTPLGCSVPVQAAGTQERDLAKEFPGFNPPGKTRMAIYRGTTQDKQGELFIGVSAEAWKRVTGTKPGLAAN